MRNIKGTKGFQKLTHEEFIQKASQNNDKLNIIGIYKRNSEKIDVECKKCRYQWQSLPSNILKNKGCPKCSQCYQCTHEEFVDKLYKEYGNEYSVLGNYVNSKTKIRIKHNICGHEFDATPSRILSTKDPRRCPNCFGGIKYTNEEFTKKVYDLVKDEYIFLEEYKNMLTKIKCRHNVCGHSYFVMPNDFVNSGHRCPYCNQSKGELRCQQYFDNKHINYIAQETYDGLVGLGGKLLSYDFYLPDYNLLIEYQGEFHDGKANWYVAENLEKQQEHDRRKRQYAKENNIELLEIWYWDYENIEQILESRLLKQSA